MKRTRGARPRARLRLLLAAALLAALAGCGKEGSPPVKGPQPEDLPVYKVATDFRLPQSPTWEKARKRGHLVVGAKEDQPYMGEKDPASGRYSGFDIEIAKMMSASLGFDPKTIEFKTIASANRETALQNGQIDYYVGTYTINDNRKKQVGFAGPTSWPASPSSSARTRRTSKAPRTSPARRSAPPPAPPRTSGSRRSTRRRSWSPTTPTRSAWTTC